ncbi:hypothetical protein [Halolamina sp. C58]|uniref:hypothetical protein n=1 Tax=Halolamina sp. C58 TaxID=3421640 RepID=UPI003EBA55E6
MTEPNPSASRSTTPGTREPRLGTSSGMLVGTLLMGVVLLGGLFTAVTSPALFTGLAVGLGAGAVAGVVATRRRASRDRRFCVPRTSACVRL